jgi:hypothetical protein
VTFLSPAGGQRGTTVEVTAGGSFDKWPVEVWVSGKGVTAVAGKDKGKLTVTVAADAEPGPYWVRVYDDTGSSGLRPFVVGTRRELAEKEPNNDPGEAQAVDPPAAVVNGRLEKSGDVDTFAVKLRKGQTLVADVEAHRTLRSPMDAVVQAVSADGFVLDQDNDTLGLDPRVVFTAPADGTYLARVFAFPATPDSSIKFAGAETFVYRLTLTTGGYIDHSWPLAVPADDPGTVELVGWNVPVAAKAVAVPPGRGPVRVFHPEVANTATVAVEPHPCWVADAVPMEPLTPPFTVSGKLTSPREAGRFMVAGRKGKPLTLSVAARDLGFPLSPVLTVSDPAGKVVGRAEPRGPNDDVELTATPTEDGPLTVEVRDLFRAGGPRYAYRLTVRPAEPDYTLTVASDRITCPPGKPTDLAVTMNRKNGFAKDVTVTVEGLPDGVTAAVAKSDAKAITLRLEAKEKFAPGPVRIVGTVAGEKHLARTATAALADFGTAVEDLWLAPAGTAPPPKKSKR